jgi:hypothetical protein
VAFSVCAKQRVCFPSFTSSIVDRFRSLWEDPTALRTHIEDVGAEDVIEAAQALLLREAGEPRSRAVLCLRALRAQEEIEELPQQHADLVGVLVRAKEELAKGKEEHCENARHIQLRKQEAEATLAQELAQLGPGQVKRVNMLESDGTTASFYLRLKKPRAAAKRKITAKALRGYIHKTLEETLGSLQSAESLAKFCDPAFGESFLSELKTLLCRHEVQHKAAPAPRVALDRIRATWR